MIIPLSLLYRQPPPQTLGERESPLKPNFNWRKLLDSTPLKDKSFVIFLLGISLYATKCYVPATHAIRLYCPICNLLRFMFLC